MRLSTTIAVMSCVGLLASSGADALTFSVDQPPNGSAITDGVLLQFNTPLDGTPDATRNLLVGIPVDALHIGAPQKGLLRVQYVPGSKEIQSWTWTGWLALSLDDGDPFPIGVSPDRDQEIWVAAPYGTAQPANGNSLRIPGDMSLADEPHLGLGPNKAFDDDVDGLDTRLKANLDQENIFFSIDDRISLVPNLDNDFHTVDIFVRVPGGGIGKVLDGVADLGLVHQGDGPGTRINDDIDAMIFLDLDDCAANNFRREVEIEDIAGNVDNVTFDLGDGILFSLDNGSNPAYHDLPYQNAGVGPNHFQPSIDTHQIYLSTYNGLAPTAVRSHAELGLLVGQSCCTWDDIDALAVGEPIPEPGTIFLVGTGVIITIGIMRRRRIRS